MVIPSTPGLPLFLRTRFHAASRFSRLHTSSISCSAEAGLSGPGFAADGSALGEPPEKASPSPAGSKATGQWIFCRFPFMSRRSLPLQSFGPSTTVSGSAYLLLRLPALECLTSLANCVALLCPLLTSAPRSSRLAAPSVLNLEQRRRSPQVSPIAFPAPRRIYRLGL